MDLSISRVLRAARKARTRVRNAYSWHLGDFYFIHIPKTGGLSIGAALHYPQIHQTARTIKATVGKPAWEKRFTFSVVRNPWDRLVSFYEYELEVEGAILAADPVDFTTWVTLLFRENRFDLYEEKKYRDYLSNQSDWVCDEEGDIMVDFIARFEELSNDFTEIQRRLGRRIEPLPHLNRSKKKSCYREYFNSETRDVVADFYCDDISLFGYEF